MRGIGTVLALLLAMLAAGCASRDSTVDVVTGHGTVYRLSENDALVVAWQAVHDAMPGSRITEYHGARKGYWIEFFFGLDTYGIDAFIIPGIGTDAAGNEVAGHYYEVSGGGTSFLQGRAKAAEIFAVIKRAADATGTQVEVSNLHTIGRLAGGDGGVTFQNSSAPVSPSATSLSLASAKPPAAQDGLSQLAFRKGEARPDDIAVIIGNSGYDRVGRDLPAVPPAKNDAAAIRRYAGEALGVSAANVIFLEDATSAQLVEVFGNERDHRGKLFNWVKPKVSRVFVYYAGHGAPAGDKGGPMLVPVDASASQIALSGYPLATLYANLAKLPAESVTVVLEACFSGATAAGSLVPAASPVSLVAKEVAPPAQLTVLAAGTANQIASWRQDRAHGLFTEFFLRGQAGEADQPPYGNGDGRVGLDELERYLKDKVTYWARREWARDQNVQIFRPAVASR